LDQKLFISLLEVFFRIVLIVFTARGSADGRRLSPHQTLVLHLLRLGKPACPYTKHYHITTFGDEIPYTCSRIYRIIKKEVYTSKNLFYKNY
jgi:hypothetical protein